MSSFLVQSPPLQAGNSVWLVIPDADDPLEAAQALYSILGGQVQGEYLVWGLKPGAALSPIPGAPGAPGYEEALQAAIESDIWDETRCHHLTLQRGGQA